jgi:hypothetical protein
MSVRGTVMLVVGTPRRRREAVMELGARLDDALGEALRADHVSLSVLAGGGVVTIRGEVRSLDQISRASQVIHGFNGDTELVNLVRLRTRSSEPSPDRLKRPPGSGTASPEDILFPDLLPTMPTYELPHSCAGVQSAPRMPPVVSLP